MPANDDIRDELVRHRVELQRFANGLASRVRAIINRAEPALRAKLKARLERELRGNPVTAVLETKRMLALARFVKSLNEETFAEVNQVMRAELTQLVKLEAAAAAAIIEGSLPVLVNLSIPDARALRSIVFARPMQSKILRDWLNQYSANDRRRFMDEIRQGMIFSETPTQISRRIFGTAALGGTDGVRQITRRGAQSMANTTTAAIFNGALQALYAANRKIVKKELYVATLDSRTTPICQSLDGKVFKRGSGPVPPIHINCRSIRVPVINGRAVGTRPANATTERNLGDLRGPARRRAVEKLVGQVPADTTYQQWLSRQNVAFQNDVLGPTRGVLFRKGGLTLDSFVDSSGSQYTLRELFERETSAFRRAGVKASDLPAL
jgi:SPP1 gp7 family putative phage head morphogenesis protein